MKAWCYMQGRFARSTWFPVTLVGLVGLVAAALALWVLPPTLVDDTLKGAAEVKAENEARGSLLQALGGIAVLVGLVFTGRTVWVNREGQLTERFTRAIEQLGDDSRLALRIGGVHALHRLAQDSSADAGFVVDTLAGFLRDGTAVIGNELPNADIQQAATVLAELGAGSVDLRGVRLPYVELPGADLRGANLMAAHLQGADLYRADLRGATLVGARLEGANLNGAHLEGASLEEAQLCGAGLNGAHLGPLDGKPTKLSRAGLEGARLREADLRGAQAYQAHLTGARLLDADLRGADLSLDHMDRHPSGLGCRRGRSPRDDRGVTFLPHG